MRKKIVILICMLLVIFSAVAMAAEKDAATDIDWVAIDLGHNNNDAYYFNKTTMHYDKDKDGNINKQIVVYEEKKVNRNTSVLTDGFYSITECKINLTEPALLLGEETFYKKSGEQRWVQKPLYLVWYPIKPNTVGESRYNAVADYVQQHPELTEK